jgi:hypothetical protein
MGGDTMTIKTYRDATIETYYDGEEKEEGPCEVRFDGNRVFLSYDYNGPQVWAGEEAAPTHYKLAKRNGIGRATLHLFEGVLEGWFSSTNAGEGTWTGMVRIQLGDPFTPLGSSAIPSR